MRIIKAPPKFGGERLEPGAASPDHGQHTRQVLESFKLDAAAIEALVAEGTVS